MDVTSLGQRWVVRYRLPNGSATDAIGWIEMITPDVIELAITPAQTRRIDPAAVIAARRAPAAAGGRDPLRTPAAELEHIALPGWRALHESLGEWTLRAAGGFTGRANSCLAVGDPGMPPTEAAARITTYAAEHGIPPRAQVILGSTEEQALRGLGWTPVYVDVDVLAARLADVLRDIPADPAVTVSEDLNEEWLAAYHESRPNDADPRLLRMILNGRPPRAFADASGASGTVAIGRAHLEHDWLGLAAIWVRSDQRRRGWGRAILITLGHWAARRGARYVYLQVAAENTAAIDAYVAMGFRPHHRYGYLAPDRA